MSYTEYDSIKTKLRVEDDSMRDEIELYMQEIDDLIDNRLRAKLGSKNIYGQEITLPLSHNTIPAIPLELKAIANNLVVAKIRFQNSEKPMLWDAEVNILDNYMERVYGYTRHKRYQPRRTLSLSAYTATAGTTITVSGTMFEPNAKLTFKFDTVEVATTPTSVITTSTGTYSFTFAIPSNQTLGSTEIKVYDSVGGLDTKLEVTA
jgi:hypothetical protein